MPDGAQLSFMPGPEVQKQVAEHVKAILTQQRQPSPAELVAELDREIGIAARWDLELVLIKLCADKDLPGLARAYLASLLEGDALKQALRGEGVSDKEKISTIDTLLQASGRYRQTADFHDMVEFMGKFRNYSPYNNLLVRIQNPGCSFYATAKDWKARFHRSIKEDARPLLILAPMHPVMLVYDLDQTDGKEPPNELSLFAKFQGKWEDRWLSRLIENAGRHRIRVNFTKLSSTNAGFAMRPNQGNANEKMRIAIHEPLPPPSRFGVLCHEMAHILLGHLGSDQDQWWPSRCHLGRAAIEIEAEATAYVVTQHLGLEGSSTAYVSRYLKTDGQVPPGVSFDMIAKVAGNIKEMAEGLEPAPLTKAERAQRRAR